ncbi:hypothetical protein JCM25156A_29170 [Komagataeibacter kakiaceti JCM 25156]
MRVDKNIPSDQNRSDGVPFRGDEKGTECGLRSNAPAAPATVNGLSLHYRMSWSGPLETAVFREGCAGRYAVSQETCRHDGCDRELSGGVS